MVGNRVADPLSGFFMAPAAVWRERAPHLSALGFKILMDLLLPPPYRDLRVKELPYTFRERELGHSKLSNTVAWDFVLLLLDKKVGRYLPVQFVSFCLVGGFGACVHLAVLSGGWWLGLDFLAAHTAATATAMTTNFLMNNALTYRDRMLSGWRMVAGWAELLPGQLRGRPRQHRRRVLASAGRARLDGFRVGGHPDRYRLELRHDTQADMGGLTSRLRRPRGDPDAGRLRRPRGDPDAGRRWRPRGDPDAVRRRAALAFLGALACLVVLPAANYVAFAGIPFDSLPQYLLLLAFLPVIAWPWLRGRWCAVAGSWPMGWLALALVVVGAGVVAKSALLAGGGYEGFAACYRAIYRSEDYIRPRLDDQPPGRCEKAWANPLARFHATRVDPELDFGPGDWNLSFVNDSRFNFYDWRGGSLPRERLPFTAQWRGVVSNPEPRDLALTYVGEARVWLGATPLTLPPSYAAARTVELEMAPGRHGMVIAYRFDDGYRTGGAPPGLGPALRLVVRSDEGSRPLRAASAPGNWRLAGRMVDALVDRGRTIVLALFWLGVVRAHWKLLLATALAAGVVYSQAGEWQVMGVDVPMTLALVIPGIAVLARSRHPAGLAAAYWCVAVLMLAQEAGAAASLDAVLVRGGGSDFLTYESLARSILNTGSLEGGEAVFHYQPLFRYALFVERLLLGDGDVLLLAFVRTALVLSVLYMAWTFRAAEGRLNAVLSIASVALLLALVNTAEVVSLLRRGVSEYPTWIAFPVCFSLFFRARGGRTVVGAFVLGLSGITRIDQAPGLLWCSASAGGPRCARASGASCSRPACWRSWPSCRRRTTTPTATGSYGPPRARRTKAISSSRPRGGWRPGATTARAPRLSSTSRTSSTPAGTRSGWTVRGPGPCTAGCRPSGSRPWAPCSWPGSVTGSGEGRGEPGSPEICAASRCC